MPDLAFLADNPYLQSLAPQKPDWTQSLGTMLANLGAGIAGAGAAGQPWFAGIAPGAAAASGAVQKDEDRRFGQQLALMQFGQSEALRRAQEEHLKGETAEREFQMDLAKRLMPGAGPGLFNVQPSAVQMGPQVAGPNANNVGNVRPVGSSTGFQQPASFDDGVALAVRNLRAYPAAFNNGQPMSLAQIAQHWAPKGDGANDPNAWAFNVSHVAGVDPNQPIDVNDAQTMARVARGIHAAEWGQGGLKPPEAYLPGVQLAQLPGAPRAGGYEPNVNGNPTVVPNGLPGNVTPPRVDPLQFAPYALSKYLAPYANAMIGVGNAETQRYLSDLDRQQRQEQFERSARREDTNAKISPSTGKPNQAVIDQGAQAAAAESDARQAAEGERMAVQERLKLYNESVRPKAIADATNLFNNYRTRQLLDAGAVSGPGQDLAQPIRQGLAQYFGIDAQGAATQAALVSQMKKRVLDRAKALGANPSNYEDKIVAAAQGGDITNSVPAIREILGIDEELTRRELKNHDVEANTVKGMKFARGGRPLEEIYGSQAFAVPNVPSAYDQWSKENPLPSTATSPAPAQQAGGLPAPRTKAELDALPRGTRFKAPDGSERVKP